MRRQIIELISKIKLNSITDNQFKTAFSSWKIGGKFSVEKLSVLAGRVPVRADLSNGDQVYFLNKLSQDCSAYITLVSEQNISDKDLQQYLVGRNLDLKFEVADFSLDQESKSKTSEE